MLFQSLHRSWTDQTLQSARPASLPDTYDDPRFFIFSCSFLPDSLSFCFVLCKNFRRFLYHITISLYTSIKNNNILCFVFVILTIYCCHFILLFSWSSVIRFPGAPLTGHMPLQHPAPVS